MNALVIDPTVPPTQEPLEGLGDLPDRESLRAEPSKFIIVETGAGASEPGSPLAGGGHAGLHALDQERALELGHRRDMCKSNLPLGLDVSKGSVTDTKPTP